MPTLLLYKILALALATLGLLYMALTQMREPVRSPTPTERRQVKQAMTGWGTTLAKHK
jgi:hypothetical protein